MKTEQEKNPFGKLEGIKTGWWLTIRCLQFAPLFIGFVALICYIVRDLTTPITFADLQAGDWLWWSRHGELFFFLFYLGLFVLFGMMLWFLGIVMEKHPDTFREGNNNIQTAIDETKRCGKGYLVALVWIALMGIMYYFVGV